MKKFKERFWLTAKVLTLFSFYFVAASFGLKLGAVSKFATFVWPPTGIAIAALLSFGIDLWPGIFLGAFLVNFITGATPGISVGIAFGNTLEALVAVYLLRAIFNFNKTVDDFKSAVGFISCAAFFSPVVSATIGAMSLWAGSLIGPEAFLRTWFTWWFGDAMGCLILAPLLLVLFNEKISLKAKKIRPVIEAAALILSAFVLSLTIFRNWFSELSMLHWPYFLFPVVLWAGLRFRLLGATLITFLIAGVSIWGTVDGLGFFTADTLSGNLFHLQTFLAVLSVSGLVFAGVITDWGEAETELRASNAILKGVIEGSHDAIFVKDLEGRYTLVNSATGQALGWPPSYVMGRTDRQLLPVKMAEKIMRDDKGIMVSKKPLTLESQLPSQNGGFRIFSSSKSPYYDNYGKVIGVIGVSRDVTEEKEYEEKLRQAVTARDEFLSVASHELKTPITSLKMQLQMTKSKIKPDENIAPSPQKLSQALDLSSKQVDRLINLVEELLDVSRIQAGRLDYYFQDINLLAVVTEVIEQFEVQMNSSNSLLKVEIDGKINGHWDRSRIEQVLVNLISNALKYAPGKEILIKSFISRDNPKLAVLSVEDRGPGIPLERQKYLFERFTRATNLKHIPGLGLGLFIVKKIIEGHGGKIEVDSAPNEGTKFVIELPIQPWA